MAARMEKTKTPGIFKRGGRYVFSYRVNGRQRWDSCRTLEEARREAQQLFAADPGLTNPDHTRLRRQMLVRYGNALDLSDVG